MISLRVLQYKELNQERRKFHQSMISSLYLALSTCLRLEFLNITLLYLKSVYIISDRKKALQCENQSRNNQQ